MTWSTRATPVAPPEDGDWARWSRASVLALKARTEALLEKHGLNKGNRYDWDLATATLQFARGTEEVGFRIQCIGTLSESEGTFLWGWANAGLPAASTRDLQEIHRFGEAHDLGLLTQAEWRAGHGDALEMLAVAGRLLHADAVWIDRSGDVTLYLLLFERND